MSETPDVPILDTISTEVDESQFKVILSKQCIKAQAFLVNKLRKQSERSKERCNFISSANSKLQFEITQTRQNINSFLISQETIKMANVELKKELLLAKDKKIEVIERVKNGEKKYEDMWIESKARYESLPFVQKLIKANDEVANIVQQMTKLEDDEKILFEEIEMKKKTCVYLDRKRIIELAEFMINEMPKGINFIKEKADAIRDLANELVKQENNAKANKTQELAQPEKARVDLKTDTERVTAHKTNESALIMPNLHLGYLDFDVLNDKLDQIKKKRADSFKIAPEKYKKVSISLMEINASQVNRKIADTEEYISSFFNKPSVVFEEYKTQNYSKMKLINILENIKIDTSKAEEIMAKVNTEKLQPVDMISADDKKTHVTSGFLKSKDMKPVETEEIEEVDITGSNADNLLIPPTQFLDIAFKAQTSQVSPTGQELQKEEVSVPASKEILNLSYALKSSQEGLSKKKVSFDLPSALEKNMINDAEKPEITDEIDANDTLNIQLDVIEASDDGIAKMNDMIMKKHNLDLTPPFVYAKNIINPLNLQKSEDTVITSKFFQQNQSISNPESTTVEKVTINDEQVMEVDDIAASKKENENISKKNKHPIIEKDPGDSSDVSSPKRQKINEMIDKPVSGFRYNQEAHTIPDSLDVSTGTTGFEDGDLDFPHCLDSSLFLSPKADIPMPVTSEDQEVLSQDVPNFLSGLRKTGLSFFGCLPSSEPKTDASAQNQGGSSFSFNFGGEEKKSRGGLFSMFQ